MIRFYKFTLVAAVVAAVGVGAFFAGRETAPTITSSSTSTTTTTTKTTKTTSVPSTTTSAPSTTVVSAICVVSQLHIAQSGGGAAAGTSERTFTLTNMSSTPCILHGYPGLLLVGAGAVAESTIVVRGGGLAFENIGPSTVKLAPKAAAYFNVGYSDVTPPCSTATAVEITPPTNTAHATVSVSPTTMACNNGELHVSAVFGSTNVAATQTTAPS
jgi:hypothetical protein